MRVGNAAATNLRRLRIAASCRRARFDLVVPSPPGGARGLAAVVASRRRHQDHHRQGQQARVCGVRGLSAPTGGAAGCGGGGDGGDGGHWPRACTCASKRTVTTAAVGHGGMVGGMSSGGPLVEYDRRVDMGSLRNDEHQRGIIQNLQHLHDELRDYHAPPVEVPSVESLKPARSFGFLSLFGGRGGGRGGRGGRAIAQIPENLPRGLYLYGDVGSGKTMLMDLFYDTLPGSVKTKTRIHFHNFMQDVHKRLHQLKMQMGDEADVVPFVAAEMAQKGNVLCFDEFQCTDVATAMILRRLLEGLMSHGVVLVTTSNRHPDELYKNGIQRESFIPAIKLLKNHLHVINLDSTTDYRKIPRPPSGVYHTRLDQHASQHAEKWFRFLGDAEAPEPRAEVQRVWGRDILVPRVSGRCAWFTFDELIRQPKSAADYLELVRKYDAFVVTEVPGMTIRERDLARRFITFIDAVYEGNAKLVLTTEKPLAELFISRDEIAESLLEANAGGASASAQANANANANANAHSTLPAALATATTTITQSILGTGSGGGTGGGSTGNGNGYGSGSGSGDGDGVEQVQNVMEDLPNHMQKLKDSTLFAGEEEAFAFARALSRLTQMESREWVERGLGLENRGGQEDKESWTRTRSKQMEDSM